MGYSDFGNFKVLPFDGYAVSTTDGYAISSNWIDLHSSPVFDITVVFTGSNPTGGLTLNKSNNLQWTGGNRPQPLFQGGTGAANDTIAVGSTNGTNTATVNGPGVYSLDQHFVGYRWVQLVYTPTNDVVTKIDAFFSWKK